MVSKKDSSEKYRLIQVSAPPDIAKWWDNLPEGKKSERVVKIIRKSAEYKSWEKKHED